MSLASVAREQARRLLGEPADQQVTVMPIAPREGWISVIALTAMLVVTGLAIDEARWAGSIPRSVDSQTGFLPFVAVFSVLLGIGLAKSRLSKVAAYSIAIVIGVVTLLVAISSAISLSPSIGERLHDLNLSVASFVHEVFVIGQRSQETSIFLLLLGSVLWGAGIFCAFAVFRHHRSGPAILLSGLILLVNVSVTIHDQYLYLIAYAIAALLLIVRLNVLHQVHSWRVLDMGDLSEVSTTFMRNGAVFVAVAVVASTVLAANASSAPLSRFWYSADDQLIELGDAVNHWLGGVSGQARGPNILFTPTQTIRGVWQASSDLVFVAKTTDSLGYRWRGATYDSFDGRSWQQLDRTAYTRPADANIVDGTADPPPYLPATTEQIGVQIVPADYGGDTFVSPGSPVSVNEPSEVVTSGTGGPFVEGRLTYGIAPGQTYTVKAVVDRLSGAGALSASELAAAGTDYPTWVSRYLEIRPDSIGPVTINVAHSLLAQLPTGQRDPYHIAMAFQDYLYRSGGFQYNTDVRGLCDGQLLVDCFLLTKQGYCEYFATAMVMMLRAVDVPARYAVGYLPGQQQADGTWRVESSAAHAWVEVYFPGYGWVEFDPTPGNAENGQQPAQFVSGPTVPVATPAANPSNQPGTNECADPLDPTCTNPKQSIQPLPQPGSLPPNMLPLAILAALLAGAAAVLFFVFHRVRLAGPEAAFDGVARLARRLGYGPQPAQTTYEYTEHLAELVPVARGDLQLIALAKVEARYARRQPSDSVLDNLARAYRRVRVGLLRLIMLRRPHLRGPRTPEDS
jgi:transglutaminase-like putative cysteine protease